MSDFLKIFIVARFSSDYNEIYILVANKDLVFVFKEQAIRSGGGKNYDSVGNNDRDGYGQPDGE